MGKPACRTRLRTPSRTSPSWLAEAPAGRVPRTCSWGARRKCGRRCLSSRLASVHQASLRFQSTRHSRAAVEAAVFGVAALAVTTFGVATLGVASGEAASGAPTSAAAPSARPALAWRSPPARTAARAQASGFRARRTACQSATHEIGDGAGEQYHARWAGLNRALHHHADVYRVCDRRLSTSKTLRSHARLRLPGSRVASDA